MNRIQFWILTSVSGLVVILILLQLFLVRKVNEAQGQISTAQQIVSQGQACQAMMKQIAIRVYSESQKTQDQGLKDLLTRQQISYNPSPDTNSTTTPAAPAPATP